MGNVAIYGFGRIGRSLLRAGLQHRLFAPRVIADIADAKMLTALFEVDTNYGRWPEPVSAHAGEIVVGQRTFQYLNTRDTLPDWAGLGIELVVDCTGRSVTRAGAEAHLKNGAKRVLVSAPSKSLQDCDAVLLPGVNLERFDPAQHRIVSMASCTTNALAPVVKVLRESAGIEYGFFSTVHAYTNSQSLTDQPMKNRRDSWAAAENVIPASSGASDALKFIWSDLKITGKAYRVPVRTGSIVELTVVLGKATTVNELNAAFTAAAARPPLQGVLGTLDEEWASSRIIGDTRSSVVDLPLTQVQGSTLASVAAWYDNEAGYATRLAETVAKLAA